MILRKPGSKNLSVTCERCLGSTAGSRRDFMLACPTSAAWLMSVLGSRDFGAACDTVSSAAERFLIDPFCAANCPILLKGLFGIGVQQVSRRFVLVILRFGRLDLTGANCGRLRHVGWRGSQHGLTSRPRERLPLVLCLMSYCPCLGTHCTLGCFTCFTWESSLLLRYCSRRFGAWSPS